MLVGKRIRNFLLTEALKVRLKINQKTIEFLEKCFDVKFRY